jgi:methionyl-tRNA formyltransferase
LSDSVGITVKYQHKEVKLIDMRLPKEEELDERSFQTEETTSGNFFFEKRHQAIWLKCHDDTWLLLTKLQLADRKIGNALDFANGYRLVKQKCPSQFEYLV